MKRNREPTKTTPRRPAPSRVIARTPVSESATGDAIVEHPDGYYWLGPDCDHEFGPFDSREGARAERDRWNEEAPSEGEALHEAEGDSGIAGWIDAETGEPAEGQSPPHFEEP
jgi:hypothetical protein